MKAHDVSNLQFEGDTMVLVVDGQEARFDLAEISPRLYSASGAARQAFEISPSGYGIHWPLLDEDLSIDGLLGIDQQPKQHELAA